MKIRKKNDENVEKLSQIASYTRTETLEKLIRLSSMRINNNIRHFERLYNKGSGYKMEIMLYKMDVMLC